MRRKQRGLWAGLVFGEAGQGLKDWPELKEKMEKKGRGGLSLMLAAGFLSTSKLNTKTPLNGAVKDKCDHKLPLHTHWDGYHQKTRK